MRARRHHVVPRFYLRRFADGRDRVVVIDKDMGKDWPSSTGDAAVITDFYTVDTHDGPSDEAEALIASIEHKASDVLRQVDAGVWPLPHAERSIVANLLALQLTRGPQLRATLDRSMTEGIRLQFRVLAENDDFLMTHVQRDLGRVPTPAELDEYREAFREGEQYAELHMPRSDHVMTLLKNAAEFVEPVFRMEWVLCEGQRAEFVTSDDPFVMWMHAQHGGPAAGLYNAEEVHMALDPGHCLLLRWRENPRDARAVAAEPQVVALNTRTALWAHRFVILRPPADYTPGTASRKGSP